LNRHDAKVAKGAMFRTLDRRTRKPVYGAFRSSVPLPPLSHFGLGVPGTQRRRWVSLAVENFGLGLDLPITCHPKNPAGPPLQGRTGNVNRGGLFLVESASAASSPSRSIASNPHCAVRKIGDMSPGTAQSGGESEEGRRPAPLGRVPATKAWVRGEGRGLAACPASPRAFPANEAARANV